jgi:hypothetical protein
VTQCRLLEEEVSKLKNEIITRDMDLRTILDQKKEVEILSYKYQINEKELHSKILGLEDELLASKSSNRILKGILLHVQL